MKKMIILILTLSMLLLAKNEYEYATIKISGIDDIKFMQENKIDIDRTSFTGNGLPETLTVYVNDEEFQMLISKGYSVDLSPLRLPKDATDFRYNEDIGDSMLVWQNRYPTICKRIQIGTSVQGRELWVLKISDNVDIEEAEPELKFVSTMHGDEVTGAEMEMYMIEDILYGYQANNDTMQFIVNNTELYVMPLMNPDGMANNSRYNANFVDLNRNFPEFEYGEPNDPDLEEPEIAAIINWSNDHNFILSTNYHGGALVTNYLLDKDNDVANYSYAACADDEHVTWLAYNYSVRNPPMFNSLSFTDGITNGCEWYSIDGGMQDWNYKYYNDIDMTLEISSVKWPAFSEMAGFWQDNRDAMFWYLSAAHKGIYGVVTDFDTGLPLDTTIEITGIDKEYYTDPDHGDYYRILKAGTYSMTVSAPGYLPQTINNIVVTDETGVFKEATEVNVQLTMGANPNITLSQTDTLMIMAAPEGSIFEIVEIGNMGGADLIYDATFAYTGSSSKATLIPESNDFESGLIYTNSGVLSFTAIAGEAILDADAGGNDTKDQSGILTSGSFDGTISSSLTLIFDQNFTTAGNSSIIVEYYDGSSWNQIYDATSTTTTSQNIALLTIAANMQLRFTGSMRNRSGDSWSIDNIVVSGPEVSAFTWLTLDGGTSINGIINPSNTDSMIVNCDATGLSYGTYTADITINSNDPDENTLVLPVKFTVSDALTAPINVVPNGTTNSVDLSWGTVTGAMIYKVYRSTDPYSGFSLLGTSGTNSFTDNDVSTGNKYFYYVTADNTK